MPDRLADLAQRYPALRACCNDVQNAFGLLRGCFRNAGSVWLCGNGGSVADAEHWAGEMLKGFESRRPLSSAERARLPAELASTLQGGLRMIPCLSLMLEDEFFGNEA